MDGRKMQIDSDNRIEKIFEKHKFPGYSETQSATQVYVSDIRLPQRKEVKQYLNVF